LQVLSGFASAAAMLAASAARAATPIDLFDDRKVKDTGFDIIYEARELDLPQNVRDGFTQVGVGAAACSRGHPRGRGRQCVGPPVAARGGCCWLAKRIP
jgi:hypothetical protein